MTKRFGLPKIEGRPALQLGDESKKLFLESIVQWRVKHL